MAVTCCSKGQYTLKVVQEIFDKSHHLDLNLLQNYKHFCLQTIFRRRRQIAEIRPPAPVAESFALSSACFVRFPRPVSVDEFVYILSLNSQVSSQLSYSSALIPQPDHKFVVFWREIFSLFKKEENSDQNMFWKISIQVKNDDVYILAAGCKISICLRNMFWWLCSKKQKPD